MELKLSVNWPFGGSGGGSAGMDNYGLAKSGQYYDAGSAADVIGEAEWSAYVWRRRLADYGPWIALAMVAGLAAYVLSRR